MLNGSQVPRIAIAPSPSGYVLDDARDAVDFAGAYQLIADPWQLNVCEFWMRRTKRGRWCSSTWGVTVPRQNGKNGSLEIVELFGMVELGLRFLHTAHEVKTARKAFRRLKYFFGEKKDDPTAKFPELNALVREVRNTNGQEAIELKDGGAVEFIARSKGSGRGYTVDVLVLDEAQDLTDDQLEALLPTISAAPSGDPVTIFMGTPPKDNGVIGEPFVRARDGAIDGTDRRIAWVEHSAPGFIEDMDPRELESFVRDPKNAEAANPALGRRINAETIESERSRFSLESFCRERLNMWPKLGGKVSAIPMDRWADRAVEVVPESWPLASIGIDMNPERTKVSITMALFAGEGIHVEMAADEVFDVTGTKPLVDWIVSRAGRRIPVVMDAYSPLRSIEPDLKKRGCKVFILGPSEVSQGCMGLFDAVTKDESISHFDQDQLNVSLKGAVRQKFGDGGAWKFNRKSLETDLSPTMATVCAHFGAVKFGKRRTNESGERRGKVLIL